MELYTFHVYKKATRNYLPLKKPIKKFLKYRINRY